MNGQSLEKCCIEARKIVTEVAGFIKSELGKVQTGDIEVKSINSLVSYVDKGAEERLVEKLGMLLPEATFLTEEETVENQDGEYQWIIDPLDGTTNFLHQLPFFSISVALRKQDEIIMGIVYEVNRDECFYAWKGGGAFLNNKPIQVNNNEILQDALLATGFPYYDYSGLDAYMLTLRHFMKNSRGIRRYGSAALDLVYVACGRYDAYYEYSLNSWDVAAGALIVQEAGGIISDFKGEENYLFGREIIAASSKMYATIADPIRTAFYPA